MKDMSIGDMLAMQRALQDKYGAGWEPMSPETGRHTLLWSVGEIGEVIDILKKNGCEAVMKDEKTRAHFVEEIADVLMYFGDLLLCFGVSAEELSEAYQKKHDYNMTRWD